MKASALASLFLALTTACGGSSPPPAVPATAAAAESDDSSCPVAVAGTSVTVEDAADGAALVFVTTGDAADVRRRVAKMGAMHNEKHAAMGPLPDGSAPGADHAGHDMGGGHAGHDMAGGSGSHDMGGMGGGHAGHAGGMIGVHSKATASDVEGGAKLAFVANGGDVGKLQGELRMHAQHFAAGTCAMATP